MKTVLTAILALFMFCILSVSTYAAEANNRYNGKNDRHHPQFR